MKSNTKSILSRTATAFLAATFMISLSAAEQSATPASDPSVVLQREAGSEPEVEFVVTMEADKVRAALLKNYPQTKFGAVSPTYFPGIYEVEMGQNIVYVEPNARFFFFGRIFDMATQTDITKPRQEQLNAIDVSQFPKEDAVKVVRGDGSRTLYVFTDPDCPFCQRLEQNIQTLDNVTIYNFLYPIASLHPDAERKSRNIWCSPAPAQAFEAWMLRRENLPDFECANPVQKNVELGNRLSVTGTPTMFSGDGRRRSGATDAETLDRWLNDGQNGAAK